MKTKCVILICILVSVFHLTYAQPAIQWQNTIGGTGYDELFSMQQTSDGGYILGGFSDSDISGDKTTNTCFANDYWMVKTDVSGNILWQKDIGGNGGEQLFSIQQTADGGYILGGFSSSNISCDKNENSIGGSYDYWMVKTDATGNIQWQNTIGGNGTDRLYSIQQTIDGGYILGGNSDSNTSGDKTENSNGGLDYWVVKTDASGNIQWQNTIGGSDSDNLWTVRQTTDGGYILGGSSSSNISGDKTENSNGVPDYWIVKTDASGNIQWQNTIGGNGTDIFTAIQQTSDGGYILGGLSISGISGDKTENGYGNFDYWIIKTDAAGNIQWQNTIGGNNFDDLYSLQQTTDGGFIIGGYSDSDISGDKTENSNGLVDYWVVKINVAGNILWQKTIGANNHDWLYYVQQTTDGGYILGGISDSDISGDKTENSFGSSDDYWIVKLGPDSATSIYNFEPAIADFKIFPNPVTSHSKLTFSNPGKNIFHFMLTDITGNIIEISSVTGQEISIEKRNYLPGIYLFKLINEMTGQIINGKIVMDNN